MKRAITLAILIAIAFGVVLLSRFPARWAVGLLPEGISCQHAAGTIWNGSCQGLTARDMLRTDVTWRLRPVRLLSGKLSAQVNATRMSASLRGDIETTLSGAIVARDVEARLPLDPNVLPQLPRGWRGQVHAVLPLLRVDGRAVTDLRGNIELRGLEQVAGNTLRIGDYAVTFPADTAGRGDGTEPVGELRDLGGPLSVQGTLRLTREPGFVLEGLVAARQDAQPELARQLQYLGSPDAQGRRSFSIAGTY